MAESSGKCEEAQTSADMLRNTPSNIRRLADEIQQCEGRQKYLAHTQSPSDGGDVRWFFSKVPMAEKELAAAVPRTEIVGKSDYFRFGMRDSLAIEASFLQQEEELLSRWWKEYAECSVGPKGSPASNNSTSDPRLKSSLGSTHPGKLYAIEEERVGVPVKGGLYEVDLVRRHCFPVYWNGENRRVLRGHWFARKGGLDWLPLREDVSEQLEFAYRSRVWHRRTFQPSGLFAARVDMQGSSPGLHALFTGEDDTWDAWLNTDSSGISSMVNFSGSGIKLRRGYAPSNSPKPTQDELRQRKEEEIDDYCSQVPVRHLVFMVHGIGQRLEKANLVDDVGTFRHITASLAERHLTSYQRGTQRVLFIPCQWRKDLKLSGESAVEKCTLPGVRGLRVTLSATVHDVLYYMSPIYCQDIIDSVSNQLNKLYLKFLKRNPGYDGKISLYGHSLGSVLSYDILCHQEILSSPFPMEWMYKDPIKYESSSHNAANSSSQCNSPSNFGLAVSKREGAVDTNKGRMDSADPAGKGIVCAQSESSRPEMHAEESSPPFVPPFVLDSDENLSVPMESKRQDSPKLPLLLEAGVESDHEPSEMQSKQNNSFDECQSISSNVLTTDSNQINEEFSQRDTDNTIKSLMEEIDVLKARIKELESTRAEGNRQEVATVANESTSGSSQSGRFEALKSYTPYIKYTKLEFKVDTFFAVGSPLGVFLALRNVRMGIGKGKDYWVEENINEEMPSCRQMFNIFHPFDPVAYRVEPLVCKECINKRPVIIPYHRGGKRLHIGFQDFVEDVASRSQVVIDHMSSNKVLRLCQSKNNDDFEETSDKPEEEVEKSYGSIMLERLTGSEDGRIDHVLQDKTFQHQYISAVGAHTNYWRDPDTALFILRHLYRDIPDDAETPHAFEDNSMSPALGDWEVGWYEKEETTEEELPLTFADSKFVKKFSRRAKKFMNR